MPKLSAEDALPSELFSYSDTPPAGENLEDGSKRFHVSLRVKSAKVREIPPLPFSYFNPKRGVYVTVKSLPIALSVKGSSVVDASAVIAARTKKMEDENKASDEEESPEKKKEKKAASGAGLVGADLSLSHPSSTLKRAPSLADRLPLIATLYFLPVIIFIWRLWLVKTEEARREKKRIQRAVKKCLSTIKGAAQSPARDSGSLIANALKRLRTTLGISPAEGAELIYRLENIAFDPASGDSPLPKDMLLSAKELAGQWEKKGGKIPASTKVAGLILFLFFFFSAPRIEAGRVDELRLAEARTVYQKALLEQDRNRRVAGFAKAVNLYGELAGHCPNCPGLLADWGNAALGASDIGTAVLAYNRALAASPGEIRASRNLEWIRGRMPTWLPVPEHSGAVDTLFFWRRQLTPADRLTAGAICFAVALLLIAPWGDKVRPLRWLAVLPAFIWLLLTASALMDRGDGNAAVVTAADALVRSADSSGALASFPKPLPPGTEVTIVESRRGWYRIELANGKRGWLKVSEVEKI